MPFEEFDAVDEVGRQVREAGARARGADAVDVRPHAAGRLEERVDAQQVPQLAVRHLVVCVDAQLVHLADVRVFGNRRHA